MNKVFILGAGASRELKFYTEKSNVGYSEKRFHLLHGPLSSGFVYYVNEFVKEIGTFDHFGLSLKISDEWLINFILDYYLQENKVSIN